jgi:O-antigen ligase
MMPASTSQASLEPELRATILPDFTSRQPQRAGARPLGPVLLCAGILASIGFGILWLGPDAVIDRITGEGSGAHASAKPETLSTNRGWIWRDTLRMISANPVTGVGLGAFQTAFPIYSRSDGSLLVSQAHNDYLQVVADAGLVGGALAVWFIVVVIVSIARGLRSRDAMTRGLALGAGTGIVAMMVHSAFDFNLQIPSNALMFLMLVVIADRAGERPKTLSLRQTL